MSSLSPNISQIAANLLAFSPSAYIKSWLLYLGIQTHVRDTIDPELKPLHNVCEYLNALHIYAEEARVGKTRAVEAYHFCSHVNKNFRQCLIYDSNSPTARLIGVEYMIPRAKFESLPREEKKYWHSHSFEVVSGMLVLPSPPSHRQGQHLHDSKRPAEESWQDLETEALKEVVGWYGKTYHFWQIDRGDEIPLGEPKLMGSLTSYDQIGPVEENMIIERDQKLGVSWTGKRSIREKAGVEGEVDGAAEGADNWWTSGRKHHTS